MGVNPAGALTMTPNTAASTGQPSLADLMIRFLATRSDASAGAVETAEGDVEPFEVAAGFRVDPRAAWIDAVAVLKTAAGTLPTEWASLVAQPAAAFAVAMAAGNFPQRVKDLQPLLTKFDPAELRPSGSQLPNPGLSGLRTWIARETKKRQAASLLLAAGVARAIGEFDWAREILADAESLGTGDFRSAWENERAALLWHSGDLVAAVTSWNAMADSPPTLFNRGMANLFLGRFDNAKSDLTKAIAVLPETSGWSALARLYLAVAEIHG
jgi:tetratricopeptide (TPR) repeat protein